MSDPKSKPTARRTSRPTPARTGPVRNVPMAFRTPKARPASTASASGPAPDGEADGVVESAVRNAYRVFDEYMKRGEQAAWSACPPHTKDTTMGQDGQWGGADAMRFWQEMWTTYMRNVQTVMQGMPGGQSMPTMPWGIGGDGRLALGHATV